MTLFENLFKSSTKEEKFWSWFVQHKGQIAKIQDDHSFLRSLAGKIKDYDQVLTFEIGIQPNGILEFIISCDGIRKGIPIVEKLANAAPTIEGVKVIKFRQPKKDSLDIQIGDLKLSSNDIYIQHQIDKNINIQFFIKDYNPHDQRFGQIAFILLDNIIGEYLVMTKIGTIDFQKLNSESDLSKMTRLTEFDSIIKAIMN